MPKTETEKTEEPKEQDLVVKSIDCHMTENAHAHHTEQFQQVEKGFLIVRRGQKFEVTVTFNREFDIRNDQIAITFVTGKMFNTFRQKYSSTTYRWLRNEKKH